MKEIVDRDEPITREVWSRDEAIAHSSRSASSTRPRSSRHPRPARTSASTARGTGKDLCRGLHLPSTKAGGQRFKLTKLPAPTGAATTATRCCSASTARLGQRGGPGGLPPPHRGCREAATTAKSAKAMDLFHLQERPRGDLWHPRAGRSTARSSPTCAASWDADGLCGGQGAQLMDRGLWEKSATGEVRRPMFTCETEEGEVLAVKPMNCPGTCRSFNHGRSPTATCAALAGVRRLPPL